MEFIQIPVPHGTPLRQVMEGFIKALTRLNFKQDVVESELYWLMEERRRGQQLSSKQRNKIDYERIQGDRAGGAEGPEAVSSGEGSDESFGDPGSDGDEAAETV